MIKLPYFKIIIAALNKLKMPCRSFDFPLIRTRNRRNHNLFFQSLLSISSFNFSSARWRWRWWCVRSEKNSTENGASGGIKFVVIVLKLLPPFLHSAPSTWSTEIFNHCLTVDGARRSITRRTNLKFIFPTRQHF